MQETDQDHRKRISGMEKDVASVDRFWRYARFFLVIHPFLPHYFCVYKIEEMRITIEDLEALIEQSDGLEEAINQFREFVMQLQTYVLYLDYFDFVCQFYLPFYSY